MGELPFTIDQFLQVFEDYNRSIWPAHIFAYLLGALALVLLAKKRKQVDSYINLILSLFWIWMGGMYHLVFFSTINIAAYAFGVFFILQGLGFIILSWSGTDFHYTFRKDLHGIIGWLFIIYAMIVYPLLGYFFGHIYPQAPVFGVAPCPTTIFTFGLLLQTKGIISDWLLVIPGLWSLIGFLAAYQLSIFEDLGLGIAGIAGILLILNRNIKTVSGVAYNK